MSPPVRPPATTADQHGPWPPDTGPHTRWQVVESPPHTASLGQTTFVFHGGSGKTHLLNSQGLVLLALLEERPASLAELAAELAAAHGGAGALTPTALRRLFWQLDLLGLIEPLAEASPPS